MPKNVIVCSIQPMFGAEEKFVFNNEKDMEGYFFTQNTSFDYTHDGTLFFGEEEVGKYEWGTYV